MPGRIQMKTPGEQAKRQTLVDQLMGKYSKGAGSDTALVAMYAMIHIRDSKAQVSNENFNRFLEDFASGDLVKACASSGNKDMSALVKNALFPADPQNTLGSSLEESERRTLSITAG